MKRVMTSCGGCRTCEMACSFHHTGEYNPSVSSIRIVEDNGDGGYCVLLIDESHGSGFACDGCNGLETPLCVQYCREKEELEDILRDFLQARSQDRERGI